MSLHCCVLYVGVGTNVHFGLCNRCRLKYVAVLIFLMLFRSLSHSCIAWWIHGVCLLAKHVHILATLTHPCRYIRRYQFCNIVIISAGKPQQRQSVGFVCVVIELLCTLMLYCVVLCHVAVLVFYFHLSHIHLSLVLSIHHTCNVFIFLYTQHSTIKALLSCSCLTSSVVFYIFKHS